MMRMGTWLQHVHLRDNAGLAEQWLYGNRSVLGGLVGAWLGVHVAKRLVGYRLRTGDLFAPAVALGMAVGRVGCLLTERPGTPTGTSYGITLDAAAAARLGAPAGVPLHPSFAYEIAFQLARVRRAVVLAASPRPAPGDDLRPVRRGLRRLPLPRRVRARQRGRVARPHPAAAVPRSSPSRSSWSASSCCSGDSVARAAGHRRRTPRPHEPQEVSA